MSRYSTLKINVYKVARSTFMSSSSNEELLKIELYSFSQNKYRESSSFPVNRSGSLSVFSCLNPKITVTLMLGTCCWIYPHY